MATSQFPLRAEIHVPLCEQAMVHSHNSMLLAKHHVLLALLASSLVAIATAQGNGTLTAGQALPQVGACGARSPHATCGVPSASMGPLHASTICTPTPGIATDSPLGPQGQALYSKDGRAYLLAQSDGNLVLYSAQVAKLFGQSFASAIWASATYNTNTPGPFTLFMTMVPGILAHALPRMLLGTSAC